MTKPSFNYDEMSDTLYVSFEPGVKATEIELNDHILLRISKKKPTVEYEEYEFLYKHSDCERGELRYYISG